MTTKKKKIARLRNGNLQGIEKELRDAIEATPNNISHYIELAKVLHIKGRSSEAIDMLLHAKDRFVVDSERTIIQNQLEKLSDTYKPWDRILRIWTESSKIETALAYCGHKGTEDLLEEKLWEYAQGDMELGEEESFWRQVKGCKYCLSKLIGIQSALNDVQQEPGWIYDKIYEEVIEKKEREDSVDALTSKLQNVLKKCPPNLQKRAVTIREKIENLLRATFAYPTPHFSPVLGEFPVGVLSPFGKVRYPVVFEWHPYEHADRYIISIEDANWSFSTSGTRVEVSPQDLELMNDTEYMWGLDVIRGNKVIEQENGFFSLPSEMDLIEIEEIGEQLKVVSEERDKFILWGAILEQKGFLMEAIENYKKAYAIDPLPGIAYRTAYCYDKLELEELRDEWNKKTKS